MIGKHQIPISAQQILTPESDLPVGHRRLRQQHCQSPSDANPTKLLVDLIDFFETQKSTDRKTRDCWRASLWGWAQPKNAAALQLRGRTLPAKCASAKDLLISFCLSIFSGLIRKQQNFATAPTRRFDERTRCTHMCHMQLEFTRVCSALGVFLRIKLR